MRATHLCKRDSFLVWCNVSAMLCDVVQCVVLCCAKIVKYVAQRRVSMVILYGGTMLYLYFKQKIKYTCLVLIFVFIIWGALKMKLDIRAVSSFF